MEKLAWPKLLDAEFQLLALQMVGEKNLTVEAEKEEGKGTDEENVVVEEDGQLEEEAADEEEEEDIETGSLALHTANDLATATHSEVHTWLG